MSRQNQNKNYRQLELRKPGTMVISNDGYQTRMGQVADHVTDSWGTWHVVLIKRDGENAEFETVGVIDDEGRKGIGWKVASKDEVKRFIKLGWVA